MTLLALLFACDTSTTNPSPAAGGQAIVVGHTDEAAPLTLTSLDDALSPLVQQAIAAAPRWLRPDLELSFRRVGADKAEELAELVVDLDDPWLTDELCFSVAHLSPEVLADDDFDSQLLVENVDWIRDIDPDLAYVDVVDTGEPGVDDDYSSTVRYTVEVGGELQTVDLPSDVYYWYIVHPRIEDERPLYIDAWSECHRRGLECATTSDEGAFWRSYLWEGAANECPDGEWCPVLKDSMTDATYLWSDAGGGVGAVGAIASFMLSSDPTLGRWFNFGAGSERSIQPNRIYGLGAGNCGEWADMTTALSRIALIPNYNIAPSSWDHTWNAFYDPESARWVRWEPVNWWFDHDYGAPYANHATRGDARVLMVTDDDTTSWFTMQVVVTDQGGAPIDGALVSVWSPYDSYWWYAGEQATDATGTASFPLTAGQQFAYRVDSPIGGYPASSSQITTGSDGIASGETDVIDATIDAALPSPTARVAMDPDAEPNATLSLSGQLDAGRIIAESLVYDPDTFTVETNPPTVRWFVTTADGYAGWLEGAETPVLAEGTLGEDATLELDTREDRVLVISNEDSLSTAAFGSFSATLTPLDDGDAATQAQDLVLPPGEHTAILLSGGG